jgi:pimeloyl-ACP methyl ester carboxylesterase
MPLEHFQIDAPTAVLDDLYRRLERTRLPGSTPGPEWSLGIPVTVVERLISAWRFQFDWGRVQSRLNTFEQYQVEIGGTQIHFLRRKAAQPGRLPVILTHGWPYTFAEMLPTVEALQRKMDVIVPSLPGFTFSGTMPVPFTDEAVADRWHTLMTDVLGYDRFLTYGEDVGAFISDWTAAKYRDSVAGIVASHASWAARDRPGVQITDEEQTFFDEINDPDESGYAHLQASRPDTLAVGLTDSPAGLLAWIVEKYASWSGGTGLEGFRDDELLTPVMLYWLSGSIGTSLRPYSESRYGSPHPLIEVPAWIVVQRREAGFPRSLAEKSYRDIRAFSTLEHGGHFPAWETPGEVAEAILALEAEVR